MNQKYESRAFSNQMSPDEQRLKIKFLKMKKLNVSSFFCKIP
jgi:hypothetical protein